jgi:hypothetical protein
LGDWIGGRSLLVTAEEPHGVFSGEEEGESG